MKNNNKAMHMLVSVAFEQKHGSHPKDEVFFE
jgi:hypothetical protein